MGPTYKPFATWRRFHRCQDFSGGADGSKDGGKFPTHRHRPPTSSDSGEDSKISDGPTNFPPSPTARFAFIFSYMESKYTIDRKKMIELLNDDLSREYQAIIAYINYSQVLKGAQYMDIARELEKHAAEELSHALKISKQIDYLGGMPTVTPKPVKTSEKAEEMLRYDLDNERVTVANYRKRIQQADAMGEFALSEILREIIVQEQEHLIDLATALGIDAPDPGEAE
jgi:bacterioferritin